jgi:hypothetical protein
VPLGHNNTLNVSRAGSGAPVDLELHKAVFRGSPRPVWISRFRRAFPEKPLVQLITHTLPRILAPFQTRLGIIIRDKPAPVAHRLHLARKEVYLPAAIGTNLCFNRRRPDIIRAGASVSHYRFSYDSLL